MSEIVLVRISNKTEFEFQYHQGTFGYMQELIKVLEQSIDGHI